MVSKRTGFSRLRRGLGRALAGLVLAGAASAAAAQTAVPPQNVVVRDASNATLAELTSRRTALFQRMLDRPDDLDVAFAYAAISVRLGDIEGAISTLERMLIFAPDLARLQLELSLLYFRLNAYESARNYLERALAQDLPGPVRERAEALLARIDASEDRNKLAAELRIGLRYQTNANRGPGSDTVTLNGLPFTLDATAREREDGNVFAAGKFHYARDLEGQGDTFDIDVIGYGAKQFEVSTVDTLNVETSIGPSFDLGRFDIDNTKLGVFAIGQAALLDQEFYLGAVGLGARLVSQLRPETGLVARAEWRHRMFQDIAVASTGSDRTGDQFTLGLTINHILRRDLLASFGGVLGRTTAREDHLAFDEQRVQAGLSRSFADPTGATEKAWIANITAGAVFRQYDAPDPVLNPTFEQVDDEFFVSATLTMPLKSAGWAAIAQVEYRDVQSTYDTNDHDNFAVTLALSRQW